VNGRSSVRKSENSTRKLRPDPAGDGDRLANHDVLTGIFEEEPPMAGETAAVSMTVNGKPITANVDPRTLLVQLLRENLRLTGTHVGCDTSQCGACVVHVNGKAIKSCTVLALQLEGATVLTIEGLAPADGPLHPMQEAFRENHGLQCGYCTPGMIMTAVDIVRRKGHELDDRTIREELEGNICRCTGYHNIVKAIAAGARAMRGGGSAAQAAE
jgi:aerobic carbon-monoxide dehydrogenase small subunit